MRRELTGPGGDEEEATSIEVLDHDEPVDGATSYRVRGSRHPARENQRAGGDGMGGPIPTTSDSSGYFDGDRATQSRSAVSTGAALARYLKATSLIAEAKQTPGAIAQRA